MGVISFKPVLPSPPSQPSPIKGEGANEAANVPELPEYIPLSALPLVGEGQGEGATESPSSSSRISLTMSWSSRLTVNWSTS